MPSWAPIMAQPAVPSPRPMRVAGPKVTPKPQPKTLGSCAPATMSRIRARVEAACLGAEDEGVAGEDLDEEEKPPRGSEPPEDGVHGGGIGLWLADDHRVRGDLEGEPLAEGKAHAELRQAAGAREVADGDAAGDRPREGVCEAGSRAAGRGAFGQARQELGAGVGGDEKGAVGRGVTEALLIAEGHAQLEGGAVRGPRIAVAAQQVSSLAFEGDLEDGPGAADAVDHGEHARVETEAKGFVTRGLGEEGEAGAARHDEGLEPVLARSVARHAAV